MGPAGRTVYLPSARSPAITQGADGRFVAARYDVEAIRPDYEGPVPLKEVAAKHRISVSTLNRLAILHGWRQRQPRRLDRNDMIARLFRLLDQHIRDLENATMNDGTDQAAVLGRLVSTLDRLIAIKDAETAKRPTPRRSSKAMIALRTQIADRIAQFAQP
jgi:hypothetical protein